MALQHRVTMPSTAPMALSTQSLEYPYTEQNGRRRREGESELSTAWNPAQEAICCAGAAPGSA
jgi:hypothetical protein